MTATQRVLLVSGPSGAGRSTAINTLEDLGYEAIDNMPISFLPRLLDGPALDRAMAFGVDPRNRDFSTDAFLDLLNQLAQMPGIAAELVYLDCHEDVLVRRFSETRRRHPMAPADTPIIGIQRELKLLAPIRDKADMLIDTSDFSIHDLRDEIQRWLGEDEAGHMAVNITSFAFKRGVPRGLDLMFDCRFLQNPHWEPDLRGLTGRDQAVAAYVAADSRFDDFRTKLFDMIRFLLPAYREEGKTHLTIGFGCTGGQHRSVAVAENLAEALAESGWQVSIRHRELGTAIAVDRQAASIERKTGVTET